MWGLITDVATLKAYLYTQQEHLSYPHGSEASKRVIVVSQPAVSHVWVMVKGRKELETRAHWGVRKTRPKEALSSPCVLTFRFPQGTMPVSHPWLSRPHRQT